MFTGRPVGRPLFVRPLTHVSRDVLSDSSCQ